MICISLQRKSCNEIFDILDRPEVEMAEIRLDSCHLSDDEITDIFSGTDIPLVATCRLSGGMSPEKAENKLALAIEAGAKYADLEIEAPAPMGKRLARLCREAGTILIRSFHDFEKTPDQLKEMLDKCHRFGGEIAKIVTTARTDEDIARIKGLYEDDDEGRLIAFCMGEIARQTRIDCLKLGAPFTYAALSVDQATAPGQFTLAEMADVLYGDAPCPKTTPVRMPSSKSFAQRAILAAALTDGESHLSGYSPCEDSEAAIRAIKVLGANIVTRRDTLTIRGIMSSVQLPDTKTIDAGESGLLARLLIPVLSVICHTPLEVNGRGTLLSRPLRDANDIMASFGVMLKNLGKTSKKDVYVPLEIGGKLISGRADISGKAGSQLISGLLMALPLCEKNSAIFVHDPVSIPYMFITTDVLRKFGINVGSEMEGDEEFVETRDWALCTAVNFKIKGGQRYKAADIEIEGDWSAAAAFMVAGAVFGGVHLTGLDTSSLQADLSIMDVLMEAGASVSQDEDGTINVLKAPLDPFEVDLNNAPDLFPSVAVLACFCPGWSRISGVGRLTGKECDRAGAIEDMLTKMGVEVEIDGDVMAIRGHSLSSRILSANLLKGGDFSSYHDHRMVMALKLAELGADAPISIDDVDCVAKSFPDFINLFDSCFK